MFFRGAIIVGFFATLAAIAAPPKLRAGTKIAYLTARHGVPYLVLKALLRFSALSSVDPETCGEDPRPTGLNACYLVDATERNASLAEFQSLENWHKVNVHEWFAFMQNVQVGQGEGTMDAQRMLHTTFGLDLPDYLSSMTEEDYSAAIGGAVRSLNEDEFDGDELRPVFDWIDTNGDGVLSMDERLEMGNQDCRVEAWDYMLCSFYISMMEQFIPHANVTFEPFLEEIISEGASVHEIVSAQFASSF